MKHTGQTTAAPHWLLPVTLRGRGKAFVAVGRIVYPDHDNVPPAKRWATLWLPPAAAIGYLPLLNFRGVARSRRSMPLPPVDSDVDLDYAIRIMRHACVSAGLQC